MEKHVASLAESIKFYQEQVRIVDRIWWYFYTVTIAILGFTIGSDAATNSLWEVGIICIGYVAFSVGSATSLRKGQSDLKTFAELVETGFSIKLKPLSCKRVVIFQGVVVFVVVTAVIGTYCNRQISIDCVNEVKCSKTQPLPKSLDKPVP